MLTCYTCGVCWATGGESRLFGLSLSPLLFFLSVGSREGGGVGIASPPSDGSRPSYTEGRSFDCRRGDNQSVSTGQTHTHTNSSWNSHLHKSFLQGCQTKSSTQKQRWLRASSCSTLFCRFFKLWSLLRWSQVSPTNLSDWYKKMCLSQKVKEEPKTCLSAAIRRASSCFWFFFNSVPCFFIQQGKMKDDFSWSYFA